MIRIAIVGAGAMGREHARAFAAVDRVRIVGIHSRTRGKAEPLARGFGATVYDDVGGVFQRSRARLVVVAVPEVAIAPVLQSCLRFPWSIFMEKPVGCDLIEGEAI